MEIKMDGLNEKETQAKSKAFSAISETLKAPRTKMGTALDVITFVLALIFARCHIVFGAHPCAIALLAVLPFRIWYALAGAIIGSLTLGKAGIIYAMISVIVVFLRVIIYGGERPREGEAVRGIFCEKILLRLCSAVIGGFIISVYEVLLSGFTLTSVLFGLSMILITPAISLGLAGLFESGLTPAALIKDGSAILRGNSSDGDERARLIFFRISAAALIFLTSLSLREFELLGVSASYIFAAFITMTLAKRFGVLYGGIAGFVSSLGLSPLYSVSFALAGLAAGFLFKLGTVYALVGGCAALSLWSAYASGLTGFLTTFPEYIIGAALAYPLFKSLPTEHTEEQVQAPEKSARDMVGTMALAYQNKYNGSLDALELALSQLSGVIAAFSRNGNRLNIDKCKEILTSEAAFLCKIPIGGGSPQVAIKNLDALAARLAEGEVLTGGDIVSELLSPEECLVLSENVHRRTSALEGERHRRREMLGSSEDWAVISKMISEARLRDEEEVAMDAPLSERLDEVFKSCGFKDGTIRAFGERRKHIICAGEDADGTKITSPELKSGIELAAGIKLGTPEYFRRGSTVLMQCSAEARLSCEFATASSAGTDGEPSGDTAKMFESKDGRFFSLISDGMGSGEVAMETSGFVADFLTGMLAHGYSSDTVLHILNGIIRSRGDECSATVDLFELDLITTEAQFIKSGAAASYVKRDSSLFRIRSRTAPIGLMKAVDAERIRVEVQAGDYIIMLSDGVNQSPEEAPWLIELLAKPAKRGLQEYAELILRTATQNAPPRDDMTVCVVKINPT